MATLRCRRLLSAETEVRPWALRLGLLGAAVYAAVVVEPLLVRLDGVAGMTEPLPALVGTRLLAASVAIAVPWLVTAALAQRLALHRSGPLVPTGSRPWRGGDAVVGALLRSLAGPVALVAPVVVAVAAIRPDGGVAAGAATILTLLTAAVVALAAAFMLWPGGVPAPAARLLRVGQTLGGLGTAVGLWWLVPPLAAPGGDPRMLVALWPPERALSFVPFHGLAVGAAGRCLGVGRDRGVLLLAVALVAALGALWRAVDRAWARAGAGAEPAPPHPTEGVAGLVAIVGAGLLVVLGMALARGAGPGGGRVIAGLLTALPAAVVAGLGGRVPRALLAGLSPGVPGHGEVLSLCLRRVPVAVAPALVLAAVGAASAVGAGLVGGGGAAFLVGQALVLSLTSAVAGLVPRLGLTGPATASLALFVTSLPLVLPGAGAAAAGALVVAGLGLSGAAFFGVLVPLAHLRGRVIREGRPYAGGAAFNFS